MTLQGRRRKWAVVGIGLWFASGTLGCSEALAPAQDSTFEIAASLSSSGLQITPKKIILEQIGSMWLARASIVDASGNATVVRPSFKNLNPAILSISSDGWFKTLGVGTGRIIATYNGLADTITVTVGPTKAASFRIMNRVDTLAAVGHTVAVLSDARTSTGEQIMNPVIGWTSLTPAIVSVSSTGRVTALTPGVGRVRATREAFADTATIHVAPNTSSTPSSVVVSPRTDSIGSVGGTKLLTAKVYDAQGKQLTTAVVAWKSLDSNLATVTSAGLVTGLAKGTARIVATHSSLSDTARISVGGTVIASGNLTPARLRPLVSGLMSRTTSSLTAAMVDYDTRYQQTELQRYNDYRSGKFNVLEANHYGALRSRLMWSLRTGQPIGPAANDETKHAYARGRRIVRDYLVRMKAVNFAVDAHYNTGMPDVEALYVLDGDRDALTHLHVTAARMTSWGNGRLQGTHSGADPRMVAVAMQAFSAAHRLGIPFQRNPANTSHVFDASPGSWRAAGDRQILWIDQGFVRSDGTVWSPAHGAEAYLFSAMVAIELMKWDHFVAPHPRARALAKLIIDHLITVYNTQYKPKGFLTLPYLSTSTSHAPDLAGFYVWPALALWQDTGDWKYRDFALLNLRAVNKAYIVNVKHWNQSFSMLGHSAESMVAGVTWR